MLGRAANGGAVTLTKGLDSLAEIAQQVPSIRDLDGVRGTLANTIAVGSSTIAGDNLNAWMVPKPRGNGCGLTVREQIEDFVLLEIDQHGAVAAAPPPRPVIDPKHARGRFRHRRRG